MAEEKQKEIVVIASKLKEVVKAAECQTSGDLVEAVSDKVHEMVTAAIARAKANGLSHRASPRPLEIRASRRKSWSCADSQSLPLRCWRCS